MSTQPLDADPCNHSTDTDTGTLVCIVHAPGPCPDEPLGLAEAIWDAGYDAVQDGRDET